MKTHYIITSRICKSNVKIFQDKYLGCDNSDHNQIEIFNLSNKDKAYHFRLKDLKKNWIKDFTMLLIDKEEFLYVLTNKHLLKINIASKKEETFEFAFEKENKANVLLDITPSYNPNNIKASNVLINYAQVSEKSVRNYYDILNANCDYMHTSEEVDTSEHSFISNENYYGIISQFGLKIFNTSTNKEIKLDIFPNIPMSALELSFNNEFYFLNNTIYCENHKTIYEMPLVYNQDKNSIHIEEYFIHKKIDNMKVQSIKLVNKQPTVLFQNSYSPFHVKEANYLSLYNFKTRKITNVSKRINQTMWQYQYFQIPKLIENHIYCNLATKLILFNI